MESLQLWRIKTYDPILRTIHAVNALATIILIITGFGHNFVARGANEDAVWHIHIIAGYFLSLGLAMRILWGVIGPKHARWHELLQIGKLVSFIKEKKILVHSAEFGHTFPANLAYIFFYGFVLLASVSGLVIAASEHDEGPFAFYCGLDPAVSSSLETPHEIIALGVCSFIILHMSAIIFHEKKDNRPVAQAMISGYQYFPQKNMFHNEKERKRDEN